MGSFKQQATGKVGKRWIPIAPVSKDISPLKENLQKGPKALILFYFGEKQVGTQAMEAELKKAGYQQADDGLGGTPGILPFNDYINGSASTPLRDRDATNQVVSASRGPGQFGAKFPDNNSGWDQRAIANNESSYVD